MIIVGGRKNSFNAWDKRAAPLGWPSFTMFAYSIACWLTVVHGLVRGFAEEDWSYRGRWWEIAASVAVLICPWGPLVTFYIVGVVLWTPYLLADAARNRVRARLVKEGKDEGAAGTSASVQSSSANDC